MEKSSASAPSPPLVRSKSAPTLTVGCDGRHSTVREDADFVVHDLGSPIDVLWMRIRPRADVPFIPLGRFDSGHILVMIYRGEYWQFAFVIAQGGYDLIRQQGLDAFRAKSSSRSFPERPRPQLKSWDDIRLLTVKIDRLERLFNSGLLCIGDAAHAMSPVGGVGINVTTQDSVAAANLLYEPLRKGVVTPKICTAFSAAANSPCASFSTFKFSSKTASSAALHAKQILKPPLLVKMLNRFPPPPHSRGLVGIGYRPEHVHTPDAYFSKK